MILVMTASSGLGRLEEVGRGTGRPVSGGWKGFAEEGKYGGGDEGRISDVFHFALLGRWKKGFFSFRSFEDSECRRMGWVSHAYQDVLSLPSGRIARGGDDACMIRRAGGAYL